MFESFLFTAVSEQLIVSSQRRADANVSTGHNIVQREISTGFFEHVQKPYKRAR